LVAINAEKNMDTIVNGKYMDSKYDIWNIFFVAINTWILHHELTMNKCHEEGKCSNICT